MSMDRQKRVLMLGGSLAQVPSIKKAKEMGLYVITCDYLPNNPGHQFADEYYNVSTTDKEGVLEIAKTLHIDGVVCYASDPAAPTAAYVAESLGLPTSPYRSVDILCNKYKFRKFLKEHGFCTPNVVSSKDFEELFHEVQQLKFPVIIKPVDSSGSKGVSILTKIEEFEEAFNAAKHFSRDGRIIVEECVESIGAPLAGDAFSVNGKLAFWAFSDDHFDVNSNNPLAPVSETYPYTKSKIMQQRIVDEINRLLYLLDMKTVAYNIEVRIDANDSIYLMEVAPRNGGNGIPEVTKFATGVDMIEYTIKAALGMDCTDLQQKEVDGFWSTYMVHSNKAGKFVRIDIDEEYKKNNYVAFETGFMPGDEVIAFSGSNGAMGTMISKFSSYEEMMEKTYNFEKYVKVIVE